VLEEFEDLVADSDIFGLSSFKPLEGDNPEKRWCEVDVSEVEIVDVP
jgi:hypothetical protein